MKDQKIFCIGLSRTGTTSIYHYLEMHGLRSIHFPMTMFIHPEIINEKKTFQLKVATSLYDRWRAKKEIKALDLKIPPATFWENYDVFSDVPVPLYYRTLSLKFPDSKFIYTTRSLESWLKSMEWMFNEGRVLWKWGYINDEVLYKTYGTAEFDRELLTKVFTQHEHAVLEFFKQQPERLFIINLDNKASFQRDLCTFLNLPHILNEFPRSNEKTSVSKEQKINYKLSKTIPFYFVLNRIKSKFNL